MLTLVAGIIYLFKLRKASKAYFCSSYIDFCIKTMRKFDNLRTMMMNCCCISFAWARREYSRPHLIVVIKPGGVLSFIRTQNHFIKWQQSAMAMRLIEIWFSLNKFNCAGFNFPSAPFFVRCCLILALYFGRNKNY